MEKTINWGILAPGRIAHKFAHDLRMVEGARLHAVASRSLERAAGFAAEYGAPHAYGSYEELLDCPGLDVVYVASPHTGHFGHTLLCLERGIPVLCEKPFAVNAAQARKMVETARANNTFLMEALWTRFIPLFKEALRLLDSGYIGALKTIRADFGFRANFPPEHRVFNPALGGGSLLDVGIYPVFLATLLWGKPEGVMASAVFGASGADDSCAMILEYPGNRLAILDCSLVVRTEIEAYLYGETGTMCLHNRFINPEELSISFYEKSAEHIAMPCVGHGYYHEILEVNECLRQGKKESGKLPLDFSLQLMETLDQVRREAGIVYPGEQV
ncbi:MAG: Gfo/Idh/MocA family oxidoreductase [Bacteroidetes bacterium]|nr:Gfo/Idh/MocA family oxidoreductase [Bacteroidota bacterium]